VCQRQEDASFPLKWEFPGGKVEIGESAAAALRRELQEELDIEVREMAEILQYQHIYPGVYEVHLRFFRIRDFQGEIRNFVFQRLAWVGVDELDALDFLEGDRPLVRFLCGVEAGGLWA
jgi:8-oxo-dGTP diphosphatase